MDEAIIGAVLDLLAEGHSVEALSIEAIASRAGVGKAAIYRRWSGKEELLADAIRTLKGPVPQPAGDSVRDDLVTLLTVVARKGDERMLEILPCLMPEVNRSPEKYPVWQELIAPRREMMRKILHRGISTGELRPDLDVEVTMALLTGPVLMQRMMRWHPDLDEASLPAQVVDAILAGIGAR